MLCYSRPSSVAPGKEAHTSVLNALVTRRPLATTLELLVVLISRSLEAVV